MVPVEAGLAVREVVHDHDPVPPRERRDLLEERLLHGHGRRVVRKVQDQHLRPGHQVRGHVHQPSHERVQVLGQGHANHVRARDHRTVHVNRKRRIRHQRRIARPHQRQAQMREAFLAPDARDHLGLGIELHAPVLLVSLGDLRAQVLQAGRMAVPMVARVRGGLADLVDDLPVGRVRGIAHAQVDHVCAVLPVAVPQRVDLAEHVRRQTPHTLRQVDLETFHAAAHPYRKEGPVMGADSPFEPSSASQTPKQKATLSACRKPVSTLFPIARAGRVQVSIRLRYGHGLVGQLHRRPRGTGARATPGRPRRPSARATSRAALVLRRRLHEGGCAGSIFPPARR